jgi:hypothetical protein
VRKDVRQVARSEASKYEDSQANHDPKHEVLVLGSLAPEVDEDDSHTI